MRNKNTVTYVAFMMMVGLLLANYYSSGSCSSCIVPQLDAPAALITGSE